MTEVMDAHSQDLARYLRESEEDQRLTDYIIKKMNSGDFDYGDIQASIIEMESLKRSQLQSAIQESDSLRIGQLVNDAVFAYLKRQEANHD